MVIYLPTIISSPTPVARHREPATLVAIFSKGSVIIGKPAHNISVPVVCALHRGLSSANIGKDIFRLVDGIQEIGLHVYSLRRFVIGERKERKKTHVSRKRSAKAPRLMCSFFIATSVNTI